MKIRYLILFFIFISCKKYYAQQFTKEEQEELSFLKSEITNAKNDTAVVKALVYKSELFYSKFPDSVVPICNQAITLADKNLEKANKIEKRVYLLYKASAISNKGFVYEDFGDVPKAIEHYSEALKIQEQIEDFEGVANTFINLGVVYEYQENFDKALEFYNKAYDIQYKINDKRGAAFSLNNIGGLYENKKEYEKALKFHVKSLKLREELGNKKDISQSLNNIGANYYFLHQSDRALEYYEKAFKLREEIGDRAGLCNSYENFAKIYSEQNQLLKAESYGLKSLEIAKELHFPEVIKSSAEVLYLIYKKMNRTDRALSMHELFMIMKDSIRNDDTKKASLKSQLKYEYDKKMVADSVRVQEEKKVISAQLKVEKTKGYALYGGLALVIVFSLFVFNRFKISQKQKIIIQNQKHIVEEKHREITDSINYAERIQRSFLASQQLLNENLKDYFVLFKPKDIVSGDFYWASKLVSSSGVESFALVTADSTGHGVPGAIMSLLNTTSLESAIKDGFTEPSDILNATRKTIIERLKKDGSAEGGKDGMDCSLCLYDFENKKLTIAAAHNPVWIIRFHSSFEKGGRSMGDVEVIEIKADKMPVGKHDRQEVSFTQREIQLQAGDVIYTLTDGFPDQFGGEKGKKFMNKNLRELLAANAHLPMQAQKELLEITFKNWIGDMEQVDDVTIIGVRV